MKNVYAALLTTALVGCTSGPDWRDVAWLADFGPAQGGGGGGGGSGDFLADGTVPMTGDLDFGGNGGDNLNNLIIDEVGTATTPAAGHVRLYAKADGLLYSKDDAGTETQVSGGAALGAILADGTVPLTANWDAGSFKVTAQQLESDITTGTAPLVVASTTVVTNLNADTVDGVHAASFLQNVSEDTTPTLGGNLDASANGLDNLNNLIMDEGGTATTPGASHVRLYAKADGLFYSKDDAGTETLVSGGSGVTPWGFWDALKFIATPTNPATLDVRNSHRVLEYDAATDESGVVDGVMHEDYAGGTITVSIYWAGATATTGDVVWNAAWERHQDDVHDLDADGFAAVQANTDTVASASGELSVSSITFTQAQADGIAANESFRLKITRDADNVSDTMAGDAQLVRVIYSE